MSYDELLDVLRTRRSIRRFGLQPVARAEVERLIEAAAWAPSNHNRQPWRFLVVDDRAAIGRMAEAVGRRLADRLAALPAVAAGFAGDLAHHATVFGGAPVLIAALHRGPVAVAARLLAGLPEPALVSGEPLSVAMAVQNLLLAAHVLGLGACVLTAPLLVPEALVEHLRWPPGYTLTCMIALGYPAEQPEPPRRKTLAQVVEFADTAVPSHGDAERPGNP
jgi:nitroreductase